MESMITTILGGCYPGCRVLPARALCQTAVWCTPPGVVCVPPIQLSGLCSVSHSESSMSHTLVDISLLLAHRPSNECRSSRNNEPVLCNQLVYKIKRHKYVCVTVLNNKWGYTITIRRIKRQNCLKLGYEITIRQKKRQKCFKLGYAITIRWSKRQNGLKLYRNV